LVSGYSDDTLRRIAEELLEYIREPRLGVDQAALATAFEWEPWRCVREIRRTIDSAVFMATCDADLRVAKAYREGVEDERKGLAA
jgi:hypothetical protein